ASIAGSSELRRISEGLLACGDKPSLSRNPRARLALDFDIERNGRIQLERQSVKRRWRSLAQLEFKFANVLLCLSGDNRALVERRLDNVAIDLQVSRRPNDVGHNGGLQSVLGHVGE